MNIPKQICMTVPSRNDIKNFSIAIENTKKYCPGWKLKIFSNEEQEEFVKQTFPEYFYIYDNLKLGVAKADLFRLMYIYKNGGLYIDIKSTINKDINKYLKDTDDFVFFIKNVAEFSG
jgi:mannosyltransferase OCH1-like enzyme